VEEAAIMSEEDAETTELTEIRAEITSQVEEVAIMSVEGAETTE
jgi:hypothetical protein